MNLNCRERAGVTIVRLSDRATSLALDVAAKDLIARGRRRLVLDLAGISSLSDGDMGDLVSGLAAVDRAGGRMKLLHAAGGVRSLLDQTGLSRVFEIYDDEDTAVRSFAPATDPSADNPHSEVFIG